jgi:SOS-response transcriptional repressor LexA
MHSIQKTILKLASKEDISKYGYRKLGEKIGVDHPQKVKWHLLKLLNDGFLYKDASGAIKASSEEGSNVRLARVPLLGLANCGEPLSYADNTTHGFLTVSPSLLGSRKLDQLFAVQATGDSMNNSKIDGNNIDDGDYVVSDASVEAPQTGDYICSSVEGLANIKRFVRDEQNQVVALLSESTKPRPPIIIAKEDLGTYRIHGKVVGVVKNYSF